MGMWTLVARTTRVRSIDRERLADDDLGLALGVDVGGVNEVDACVKGAVDDPHRVIVVRVTPPAEHHRAQAQGAYLDAGATEIVKFHTASLERARAVLQGQALTVTSVPMGVCGQTMAACANVISTQPRLWG